MLLVALGAAIGAPLRYLVDRAVQGRHGTAFPFGTLIVNVVGSFLLGALTSASTTLGPSVLTGLGVGFCGALTTYSTFSYETLRLLTSRRTRLAVGNLLVSVLAGIGAAVAGFALGGTLT